MAEEITKIFVGGLNLETNKEGLEEYFSKYGDISDAVVMKQDGKSRGFGFVTFQDPKSVTDCIGDKPHKLDGREIDAKRAVPQEDMSRNATTRTKKIFLGGLSQETKKHDIMEAMEAIGAPCKEENVSIMTDKITEKPRGFGFVVFDDSDIVDKIVINNKYIKILDREVEVKKAKSQDDIKREEARSSNRSYHSSNNFGYPPARDMMYPPRQMYDMGRVPSGYDYYDEYMRSAARDYQGMAAGYSMPTYDRTGGSPYPSYGARGAYDYGSLYGNIMGSYAQGQSGYGPTRGYEYKDRSDRGGDSRSSFHPYRR